MNTDNKNLFKHLAGPVLSLALATTGHATVTQDQYFSGFKTYVDTATAPVPEPSTACLGLVGITGLMLWRRRQA